MIDLPYKDEVFGVVSAAMEVHAVLGPGFVVDVYKESMAHELESFQMPFEQDKIIQLEYKTHQLSTTFMADFIVFGLILVELKAVDRMIDREEAVLINHMKAARKNIGLLVNFGSKQSLVWKRMDLNFDQPKVMQAQSSQAIGDILTPPPADEDDETGTEG